MPSPARQRQSTAIAAPRSYTRGFTLIELLVTIAILAILMALAVPSFRGLIVSNRITSHANELIASLQIARSEAIRSNARVIMCASTNASTCAGSASWTTGWIVFADTDRNGNRNGAETILRSGTIRAGTLVVNSAAIGNTGSVTFRSDGLAKLANGALLTARIGVCEPVNAASPNPQQNVRHVSIGSGSRFAIIRASVPTCAGAPPD
ncbi:MAG: GspH/FimT family pseudopilin [Lysobacterales bacterium]